MSVPKYSTFCFPGATPTRFPCIIFQFFRRGPGGPRLFYPKYTRRSPRRRSRYGSGGKGAARGEGVPAMLLFRFLAENGAPHLGVEDETGGCYDVTRVLPDAF